MQATQATLEQTTGDLVNGMLPSVTYDREHSRITATVIVFGPADTIRIEAPIIALPKTPAGAAPWQLCWILQPDPATLDSAHFDPDNGIQLPGHDNSTPLGVQVVRREPGEEQWTVWIENNARSTSQFMYDISVLPPGQGGIENLVTIHDPTIVVTPEPMG